MTTRSISLLLVEDNAADARLVRTLLATASESPATENIVFDVQRIDRLAALVSHLDQHDTDLILLDLSLPDSHGLETFTKAKLVTGDTPIVVLSGFNDQTTAVRAVQQGAQDYLVKGSMDAALLSRAIRYAIERQRLLTAQLEAKNKLARQAVELQNRNTELDEFAHTLAHQVQGLLGQIIGYGSYLDMVYNRQLDEEGQMVVKRILQSGHKMNNVLSEILFLASVNRNDIQMAPLDMARLVTEACKRLKFEIEEYDAQITQEISWPTAVGYSPWIEEVWVNYISNALKYGGSPPELTLGADKEEQGMVRFWVQDNGAGLPEMAQRQLFKAHTRFHYGRTRGSGVGLSIVRRIIEKCGGRVGVESRPGAGSTFWFCLPAQK